MKFQLRALGRIEILKPGKDVRCSPYVTEEKSGYFYINFENQFKVKELLRHYCKLDYDKDCEARFFLPVPSIDLKVKYAEVKVWNIADTTWTANSMQRLIPDKTVFVGGLHGSMSSSFVAQIMNDLFGNCVYVSIDTDRKKYPIGSARISFKSDDSYGKALENGFVNVRTKYAKTVNYHYTTINKYSIFFTINYLLTFFFFISLPTIY